MENAQKERLARNEAFFRDVNEHINDVAADLDWDEQHRYEFFCECAEPTCTEQIPLTLPEYEHVRSEPATFVLAPGHVVPEIETVIEQQIDYLVVEKTGVAAEVAADLDPRD